MAKQRKTNGAGDTIVTFRLKNPDDKALADLLRGVPDLESRHAKARKVVRDFVSGRLVYLSPTDRLLP